MKVLKALVGVAFYISLFVVLPRLVVEKVPQDVLNPFGSAQNILDASTSFGILLSFLYAVKTLTQKQSLLNLASSVGSDIAVFYIFLFFIGFGNPESFGKVEKFIQAGPGATIMFDFTIFAQLLLAVLAVKVLVKFLEFQDERSNLKKP